MENGPVYFQVPEAEGKHHAVERDFSESQTQEGQEGLLRFSDRLALRLSDEMLTII